MQGEKLVWRESQIRHVHPCAFSRPLKKDGLT